MDRDGSGSDRRRSNLTDAVAGSFVLWPGEKGGETHTAAGCVCLPPVVGDGWLGEPLGVGHFDSLVDAKCLPVYVHARHILLPLVRRSASGVRRLRPTDIKQALQPPTITLTKPANLLEASDTVRSAITKARVGACGRANLTGPNANLGPDAPHTGLCSDTAALRARRSVGGCCSGGHPSTTGSSLRRLQNGTGANVSSVGSTAKRRLGNRVMRLVIATRVSIRARLAPRQKCAPLLNAMW